MKRYDSYKDSGIDWIGEIPSHWEVGKTKNFLIIPITDGPHTTPQLLETGIPFISAESIKDGKIDFNRKRGFISEYDYNIFSQKYIPKRLDIYMVKSGATTGNIAMVLSDNKVFTIWSPLAVFRANEIKLSPFFLYRSLESNYFRKGVELNWSFGTQQNIGMGILGNLPLVLPPLPEQKAIADFLDEKCGQIDTAVSLKEQQIDKLKELRQSVIHKAVTQGLDANTEMKDSGVDWIGKIPKHWEVRKITHLFNKIGSGTTPTSGSLIYYENGIINFLQTGDLNDGYINITNKKITEKALQDNSSLKVYPKGSLVIAMYGATIGKLGILNINTTTNQACCVLSDNNKAIETKFMFYWFHFAKKNIIAMSYGGGQPNISQDLIKSLRMQLPPLSEQEAIVAYLDAKTAEIDKAIDLKQSEITQLKSYKSSLINEVVTGKIRVATT